MSKSGIIGGEELIKLIKIISPNEKMIEDHIYLFADLQSFYCNGPSLPGEEALGKALSVIQNDFNEKSRDKAGFLSIRLHIGEKIWRLKKDISVIDLSRAPEDLDEIFELYNCDSRFVLKPNEFVLSQSLEKVILPFNVAAFVQSRTTISLHGIDVTPTNFIVPGFRNGLYLEIKNLTDKSISMPKFMSLAEVFFFKTEHSYSANLDQYNIAKKELFKTEEPIALTTSLPSSNNSDVNFINTLIDFILHSLIIGSLFAVGYFLIGFIHTIKLPVGEEPIIIAIILILILSAVLLFNGAKKFTSKWKKKKIKSHNKANSADAKSRAAD